MRSIVSLELLKIHVIVPYHSAQRYRRSASGLRTVLHWQMSTSHRLVSVNLSALGQAECLIPFQCHLMNRRYSQEESKLLLMTQSVQETVSSYVLQFVLIYPYSIHCEHQIKVPLKIRWVADQSLCLFFSSKNECWQRRSHLERH